MEVCIEVEGLFHACECDEQCSKDYVCFGVQSRKQVLGESACKFCLVVTMKSNH